MRLNGPGEDCDEVGEIRYRSELCVVGHLRCEASSRSFSTTNRCRGFVFAFPRTASKVTKEGHAPFIASPATVSFYNAGQAYERETVSDEGDHTDWFALDASLVREIVAEFDPSVLDSPDSLFVHAWAPSDAELYLAQRLVSRLVESHDAVDALRIEEAAIAVARRAIASSYRWRRTQARGDRNGNHHVSGQRVERVLRRIARDYARPLTLAELAQEAEVSVYHLCRVFRAATGNSIHRQLLQQRLRAALGLMRGERDLTRVALESGFASHAHFSASFRAVFGITPRQFRSGESTSRAT